MDFTPLFRQMSPTRSISWLTTLPRTTHQAWHSSPREASTVTHRGTSATELMAKLGLVEPSARCAIVVSGTERGVQQMSARRPSKRLGLPIISLLRQGSASTDGTADKRIL